MDRHTCALLLLASSALAAGCSDDHDDGPPNAPPRVVELTAASEVVAVNPGSYVFVARLSFKDDDGTVRKVVIQTKHPVDPGFVVTEVDARIEGTYRSEATTPLRITMEGPVAVPGLELPYEVWVVDDRGQESAHEKRTITFRSPS